MTRGLLFWILMLLWLLFGCYFYWPVGAVAFVAYAPLGSNLLLFILLALLGWDMYGSPLRGGPPRAPQP